jgi:hypothetical protein
MGVAVVDLSAVGELGKDMVILDDNSSVVAAQVPVLNPALGFSTDRMALVKVDPMGLLAPPGHVTVPVSPDYDHPGALVRQADGKLVLAGRAGIGATADFAILRFNPDLTLDAAFGDNGVLQVDFFGSTDGAEDLAIQSDGKIVVVGAARNGFISGVGMARLMP